MTYEVAQKSIFTQAEKESEYLIKIMVENYGKAQAEIIKELERIYGKYLSTTDPEDYYNIMIQYDRLNKVLRDTQQIYNTHSKKAGKDIINLESSAMQNTYYRQQYLLQWAAPAGLDMDFTILDKNLIELTVTGTTKAWNAIVSKWGQEKAYTYQPGYGTLSELLYNNKLQDLAKIQQTITQGFIQGWSVDDLSKQIIDVMDNAQYKAERIARTEMNRCANAGAHAASTDAEDQGLSIKRIWIATLDEKTRPEHQKLDGQIVGADEPFEVDGMTAMFPGDFEDAGMDINCRCAVATLAGDFKPESRAGINPHTGDREVINFKTYEEWKHDHGL